MPLTRARQHTILPVESLKDGDVSASKQQMNHNISSTSSTPSSCSSRPLLQVRVPSDAGRKSGQPSLSRTVSSPAGIDSVGSGYRAGCSDKDGKTTRLPSASRSNQLSRPARRSSTAARRQKSTTGEDSDSSDDEARPYTLRMGGCSSESSPLDRRDDSNKENVAPLRHVSQETLASEARDAETESIARRTRGRSSLTPRRSSSASSTSGSVRSVATSTTSRSAAASRMTTRTSATALVRSSPRRAAPRASTGSLVAPPSTPSSRKRRADAFEHAYDLSDGEFRLPNTPMSRLRLDTAVTSASDDSESYFSSQGSSRSTAFGSVFDSPSVYSRELSTSSRATTPAMTEDADLTIRDDFDVKAALSPAAFSPPPPKVGYSNVYAHARALFRYSSGTAVDDGDHDASAPRPEDIAKVKVVGRDQERRALHAFMSKQLGVFSTETHGDLEDILDGNCDSGSLYICGLPGTGKTALVRSVLSDILDTESNGRIEGPRIAFVNCMSIDNPRQIFSKALHALGEDVRGASEQHMEAEAEKKMEHLINHSERKILIVLDEIDHLLRSRAHQNILYRIFAWASGGCSCTLVGIANSLDLTERFVPLLASKDAAPALLHFRPFESKEIVAVLKDRLVGLKPRYDGEDEDSAISETTITAAPLFAPAALELAAKKIAAATGDLRKALDAARLAIELVEGEQRRHALDNCTASGTGTNTEASKLLSHLTPSSAPKVTPQHILKVMTAVLGSPHLTKLRQLGLQPKLLLSAIVIASRRAGEKMPVLGTAGNKKSGNETGVRVCDVESTYNAMLENDGAFTALESSEILGIFELLEVQGVVALDSDVDTVGTSGIPAAARDLSPRSTGVSPGGKRAAKKRLLACNRLVRLVMPMEDVQKGITTTTSAFGGTKSPPSGEDSSSSSSMPAAASSGVCSSIRRMMDFEEERIRRHRGWEAVAQEREEVRREELGGGRLAALYE